MVHVSVAHNFLPTPVANTSTALLDLQFLSDARNDFIDGLLQCNSGLNKCAAEYNVKES